MTAGKSGPRLGGGRNLVSSNNQFKPLSLLVGAGPGAGPLPAARLSLNIVHRYLILLLGAAGACKHDCTSIYLGVCILCLTHIGPLVCVSSSMFRPSAYFSVLQ